MSETHQARFGHRNHHVTPTAFNPVCSGASAIVAGMDFGYLPTRENVPDAVLIEHQDRRVGNRIDLRQLAPDVRDRIRVAVKTAQATVAVRPVDVSLTDICVESDNAIADRGAPVEITLNYDGLEVVLPAIAVRHSPLYARSAFMFVGVNGDHKMHPDHPLGLIIHALEAQVDRLRLGSFACLMLSALCSLAFTSWMLL